jgi:hypothetical protein
MTLISKEFARVDIVGTDKNIFGKQALVWYFNNLQDQLVNPRTCLCLVFQKMFECLWVLISIWLEGSNEYVNLHWE